MKPGPVPRFAKTTHREKCRTLYAWSPGTDRPVSTHIGSGCKHDVAKMVAANRSHAKALCVFGIFGATLAYSTYFQSSHDGTAVVQFCLTTSFTLFLVTISLSLGSQLIRDSSHLHPWSFRFATFMGGLGCVFLCFALFVDIWDSSSAIGLATFLPISLTFAVFIAAFLNSPFRNDIRWALPCLRQETDLYGGARNQSTQPSPHVAIAMATSSTQPDEEGGSDDHAAASFFLVAYYLHGGALAYLQIKNPAFCNATLEDRPTMLLSLYYGLSPYNDWTVTNSTDDVQTLVRRFLELSAIQEIVSLDPKSIALAQRDEYTPSKQEVVRLLEFEKILKSASAAASPPASENDLDGTAVSHPPAGSPGEEVSEDDVAGAGELDPLPVSSDRPAAASSAGSHRSPSSPHTPAYSANGTSDLTGGNLDGRSAAWGHMPRAHVEGETASSCDPSGSGADVGTRAQVSAHPMTEALGPDIAIAAPSAVKDDDLASLAPIISGQPVQAPDAESAPGV